MDTATSTSATFAQLAETRPQSDIHAQDSTTNRKKSGLHPKLVRYEFLRVFPTTNFKATTVRERPAQNCKKIQGTAPVHHAKQQRRAGIQVPTKKHSAEAQIFFEDNLISAQENARNRAMHSGRGACAPHGCSKRHQSG